MVAWLLAGSIYGQRAKNETIYLKNGSVIKGRMVPVDDQKVVIGTHRNTWVLDKSEIDSTAIKAPKMSADYQSPRWFVECSAGLLLGSADNEKQAPFSIDFSANFQMFSDFYAGLGAGVDFLEESYLPVFAKLEYRFRPGSVTPFVGIKGGYLVPLDGDVTMSGGVYPMYYDYYFAPNYYDLLDNKGGLMLNPSIGFISPINDRLGFSLAFGYRFSQVKFKGDDHYEIETNYNRLTIRLGILFN